MYRAQSVEGVDSLSLTIKWSGFLFSVIAFNHDGCCYWIVTSKNSGNCRDSELEDFTQLAADVLRAELGDGLAGAMRHLAETQTYLCGECMSLGDQGHGYSYKKDAVIVTCAGKYDNQYDPEASTGGALLMHLPPEGMRAVAEECGLRCVKMLNVPKKKVSSVITELENTRDFLTAKGVMRLVARHGLPVEQFREHQEVIDSETMEGLIIQYHYADKPSLRVKWKMPRYTIVTMVLRPVRQKKMDVKNIVELSTSMAKRWCRTKEGSDYYSMFGLVAGQLVKELPPGEEVAPWISAANRVFAMPNDEVICCGREILEEVQKCVSNTLESSKYVLHVQKHDSMGCAVVTLSNEEACQRLVSNFGPKLKLGGDVQADLKQHVDKPTRAPVPDKVFLAWGRQQEVRSPVSIETVILILDGLLSGKGEEVATLLEAAPAPFGKAAITARVCAKPELLRSDFRQLRLVFCGLMGSGKSTLCHLLARILGGTCITQDEYHKKGENGRVLAFLDNLCKAADNPEIPVLISDRVNSLQKHREEILEAFAGSPVAGDVVLVQFQHPLDRGCGTCDNTLELCESRILERGENHPSLLGSRHNLKAILTCTARSMEPVLPAEAAAFHAQISVDMTRSSSQSAAYVLRELKKEGLLGSLDVDVCLKDLESNSTKPSSGPCSFAPPSRAPFSFAPPSSLELEKPRSVRLHVCDELGAGMDLEQSWYGMIVHEIEEVPGQPDLRTGDCIVSIRRPDMQSRAEEGRCLQGQEDCAGVFAECFQDGAMLLVEPHCETSGILPPERAASINRRALQADLKRFMEDYEVDLRLVEDRSIVVLSGPQSAVAGARTAATELLAMHLGDSA